MDIKRNLRISLVVEYPTFSKKFAIVVFIGFFVHAVYTDQDGCSRPEICVTGATLPDPIDCNYYYECNNESQFERQQCNPLQNYDIVRGRCRLKRKATCQHPCNEEEFGVAASDGSNNKWDTPVADQNSLNANNSNIDNKVVASGLSVVENDTQSNESFVSTSSTSDPGIVVKTTIIKTPSPRKMVGNDNGTTPSSLVKEDNVTVAQNTNAVYTTQATTPLIHKIMSNSSDQHLNDADYDTTINNEPVTNLPDIRINQHTTEDSAVTTEDVVMTTQPLTTQPPPTTTTTTTTTTTSTTTTTTTTPPPTTTPVLSSVKPSTDPPYAIVTEATPKPTNATGTDSQGQLKSGGLSLYLILLIVGVSVIFVALIIVIIVCIVCVVRKSARRHGLDLPKFENPQYSKASEARGYRFSRDSTLHVGPTVNFNALAKNGNTKDIGDGENSLRKKRHAPPPPSGIRNQHLLRKKAAAPPTPNNPFQMATDFNPGTRPITDIYEVDSHSSAEDIQLNTFTNKNKNSVVNDNAINKTKDFEAENHADNVIDENEDAVSQPLLSKITPPSSPLDSSSPTPKNLTSTFKPANKNIKNLNKSTEMVWDDYDAEHNPFFES